MALLSIDEATARIQALAVPLEPETSALSHAAGRVLAADVACDRDQPPFDRAMMDGFAVSSADGVGPLRVVGIVPAGGAYDAVVAGGEAVRIMTGAPVPAGTDAVQMFENTTWDDDHVTLTAPVRPGENVARRGSELREGAVAVPSGARLTSARLGLLWSVGAATVQVVRAPRLAILSTGDELVELADRPGPSQIRDSNRGVIGDLCRRAGAEVVLERRVADDPSATRSAIADALDQVDVLVLTGGVSAGDFDVVGQCLRAEGVEVVFHKVDIRPGKPLWFGHRGAQLVFGLPGNPVSSAVVARVFLVPALRRLAGAQRPHDPRVLLPLRAPFRGTGDRPTYQPAIAELGVGVTLLRTGGSGDLPGFASANALAILPARHPDFDAGSDIEVMIDAEALLG